MSPLWTGIGRCSPLRRLSRVVGRIKDDDVALVRERARIDEVVSDHVTLRSAGSGSLKGLCPFHDEKSPSFHVTPARGFFHCFGCQEGGDVITFVQKVEGLASPRRSSGWRVASACNCDTSTTTPRALGATPASAPGWSRRTASRHSSTSASSTPRC